MLRRRWRVVFRVWFVIIVVSFILLARRILVGNAEWDSIIIEENSPLEQHRPEEDADAALVDWHDWSLIQDEVARKGLGEQGEPAHLPAGLDEARRERLREANGFDALLSDHIALNRSLKDIRHPKCQGKRYRAALPSVSLVIPFFEEHLSALQRTLVSVLNRSPPHLLKEIILVDDGSLRNGDLKGDLERWLKAEVPKAKLIRLPERIGLIVARQEGARAASGDVIVVLDSHCEVMTNWLPPLLDPIAADYRTCVCPLIDVIRHSDFSYAPQDNGGRGAFDWKFFYKRLPLKPEEQGRLPEPFENPVMNGGLFAISRKWFWELGGYDEGLRIWGGEQYDLSFKIWMCGGRILDAPCSRVGHVFRGPSHRPGVSGIDFGNINYKRVAAVWMDEYAEVLYRKRPRLRDTDPGDLSRELEVRRRLNCRPFRWFLENVAPDLLEVYPPFEPPDFANGTIRSVADPSLCVDNGSRERAPLILYPCHGHETQYFSLNHHKLLRVESEQFCWTHSAGRGAAPITNNCMNHDTPFSQIWRYDPETRQITCLQTKDCLQADVKANTLSMEACRGDSVEQRWIFKTVNRERIKEAFPPFL